MTAALAAAWVLIALIGFALQRGSTCAVLAVDELIRDGTARHFLAFFECSLWVLAMALLLDGWGLWPLADVHGFTFSPYAVLGGALFGIGAAVNGACSYGTIGRIGAGNMAYLGTLIGVFAGAWLFDRAGLAAPAPDPKPVLVLESGLVPLAIAVVGVFALVRVGHALIRYRRSWSLPGLWGRSWPPALSMAVAGLLHLPVLLLAGGWLYTGLLADLARGRFEKALSGAGFALVLIAGAVIGAITLGKWLWRPPAPGQTALCLLGGTLMGFAFRLTPGGNSALVMNGLPYLWPHALVAYASLCAAVAGVLLVRKALERPRLPPLGRPVPPPGP